ncbi:unnamed protein product [Orchesella dallaii]|uniref:Uncharacterized protein n=1 Tax=Orchesella dallaii TaxID=48710 RepID=A0ABP1S496_9HEXA
MKNDLKVRGNIGSEERKRNKSWHCVFYRPQHRSKDIRAKGKMYNAEEQSEVQDLRKLAAPTSFLLFSLHIESCTSVIQCNINSDSLTVSVVNHKIGDLDYMDVVRNRFGMLNAGN